MLEDINSSFNIIVIVVIAVFAFITIFGGETKNTKIFRTVYSIITFGLGSFFIYGFGKIVPDFVDEQLGITDFNIQNSLGQDMINKINNLKQEMSQEIFEYFVYVLIFAIIFIVIGFAFTSKITNKIRIAGIIVCFVVPIVLGGMVSAEFSSIELSISVGSMVLQLIALGEFIMFVPISIIRNRTEINVSYVNDKRKREEKDEK